MNKISSLVSVPSPNSFTYEQNTVVAETGFREYDVRWLYPEQINLAGVHAVGMSLGTMLHESGIKPRIVIGHDFRSYSSSIKYALSSGLQASGVYVVDIGLALSPMAYYAQFALECPAVAMVTASHNENGWTGIKLGMDRPLTFGPEEIARLKRHVYEKTYMSREGGGYERVEGFYNRYLEELLSKIGGKPLNRKLKVVIACGNGTAGAFAGELFERAGCEVIPLNTDPDYTFPNYNPNPEDLAMLRCMADLLKQTKADIALGFDGDGDRCGVIDNTGTEIFSDKIGLLLARHLYSGTQGKTCIVDVKSTGLFEIDPVLKSNRVKIIYGKTGHSYMKRALKEHKALAGFEKSGHFFFNPPYGNGYDDGLLTGLYILKLLNDEAPSSLSELHSELEISYNSPTIGVECPDTEKYSVIHSVTEKLFQAQKEGQEYFGHKIVKILTTNGVRVTFDDQSWGLIRASSNKPELVIVMESLHSAQRVKEIFQTFKTILETYPNVGAFNPNSV